MAPPAVEVWPENWVAVLTFCGLATQWRMIVGFGAMFYQGIDHASLLAAVQLQGIPTAEWPDLFWRIGVMEAAALPLLNKLKPGHG